MDWKTCFKGKKILVVEDDAVNQELMQDILLQMGCIVDIAQDGNEAIEKASHQDYDLILMDVRMPNKNGIEATQEIRLIEKNRGNHTPILALTASIIDEKKLVVMAGMDAIISKPIILHELRTKMAHVLLGAA